MARTPRSYLQTHLSHCKHTTVEFTNTSVPNKHTTVLFTNTSVAQQAHYSPVYKDVCPIARSPQSSLQTHLSHSKHTTVQFTNTSVPQQVHKSSVDSHKICRNLQISSTAMSPANNSLPAVGPWLLLKHLERLFLKFYNHHPLILIRRQ